jgi:hypothetical protein
MSFVSVADPPPVGALQAGSAKPGETVPTRAYLGDAAGWRPLGAILGATVIRQGGRYRVAVAYDAGPEDKA